MSALCSELRTAVRLAMALALLASGVTSTGCQGRVSTGPVPGPGRQQPPVAQQPLPRLPELPVPLPRLPLAGRPDPSVDLASGDSSSGPAAPVTSGPIPTGSRSAFENQVDQYMLVLINEERKKTGARPLRIDARLHSAALVHALDMFRLGYIEHQNKNGEWGHDRARRAGFPVAGDLQNVNENVADVFSRTDPSELARRCMSQYRESPGHWKNLLDPKWNVCGLATIYRPDQAKTDSYGEKMNPNCQLFGKI